MKPLEFNILRMILLMTAHYSFCEAFEKEGFSADVSELQNSYDAGGGKINHKAERALKKIYKDHIVNGFDEDIRKYNEITLPIEVNFSEELKVVQLMQEVIPDNVQFHLENNASFKDTNTDINEKLVSVGSIAEMISSCRT